MDTLSLFPRSKASWPKWFLPYIERDPPGPVFIIRLPPPSLLTSPLTLADILASPAGPPLLSLSRAAVRSRDYVVLFSRSDAPRPITLLFLFSFLTPFPPCVCGGFFSPPPPDPDVLCCSPFCHRQGPRDPLFPHHPFFDAPSIPFPDLHPIFFQFPRPYDTLLHRQVCNRQAGCFFFRATRALLPLTAYPSVRGFISNFSPS